MCLRQKIGHFFTVFSIKGVLMVQSENLIKSLSGLQFSVKLSSFL